MFRWLLVCSLLCTGAVAAVLYGVPWAQEHDILAKFDNTLEESGATPVDLPGPQAEEPLAAVFPKTVGSNRIYPKVAQECRIYAIEKEEVPSERDGPLTVIGTKVRRIVRNEDETKIPYPFVVSRYGFLAIAAQPGETIAENDAINVDGFKRTYRRWKTTDPLRSAQKTDADEQSGPFLVAVEERWIYRRLEVGDEVKVGQELALVDPTLAIKDLAIKVSGVNAAEADVKSTIKTKEEAQRRHAAMVRQNQVVPRSVSDDDLQGAKLTAERYAQEQISKEAALIKSQEELKQAIAVLDKHEVRSTIDGVVKVIYKNRGDAVKNLEPILQLQDPQRLRIEGTIDIQEAAGISRGQEVIVEPSRPEEPLQILRGHQQEVTSVAVSKGDKPVILSASEDRTLRCWSAADGRFLWHVPHKVAVRSVTCTPASAKANLALVGAADGAARLINLDNPKEIRELAERHRGAVICVAFSPSGEICATGSEDRSICLWETATGKLLFRLAAAHRAPVTSLQFATAEQVVSAGRDNTIALWSVAANRPPFRLAESDRRSGDVAQLGVSSDGKHVLFDQGKELRILSIADKQIEGLLQNPPGATNFTTMALFAPDGQTILTNAAAEGRLQLWRAPDASQPRAAELRQFIWNRGAATCGAFAPSGFAVTGTQDNCVLVWPMPPAKELENKLRARISLVDASLEGASRQVRVWAELTNPGWLVPGGIATMVIVPGAHALNAGEPGA